MSKILNDQPQISKHHTHVFNLINIQDKIESLLKTIKIKEKQTLNHEKDKQELTNLYNKLKADVDSVKTENEQKLQQTLSKILSISLNEYKQTLQMLS